VHSVGAFSACGAYYMADVFAHTGKSRVRHCKAPSFSSVLFLGYPNPNPKGEDTKISEDVKVANGANFCKTTSDGWDHRGLEERRQHRASCCVTHAHRAVKQSFVCTKRIF
jgi:hypothetical protein